MLPWQSLFGYIFILWFLLSFFFLSCFFLAQSQPLHSGCLTQSCPWAGSTHGLGWVGSWVRSGRLEKNKACLFHIDFYHLSERDFSSVGHTVTDTRSWLSAGKVKSIELILWELRAGLLSLRRAWVRRCLTSSDIDNCIAYLITWCLTVKKTALFSCAAPDFSAVLIAVGVLLIEAFVCTLFCPVLFLVVWVGSWVRLGRGSKFFICDGLGQSFGGLVGVGRS